MLRRPRRLLQLAPTCAAALVLLAAACTASSPGPAAQPAPKDSTHSTPASEDSSPSAPPPRDSPSATSAPKDSPPLANPPAAEQVRWWCTCYSRVGPTPTTACRQAEADCEGLERKARGGGSRSIVARSLTHACREIGAEHPGDVLGTREQWRPSERPGAWVSFGACLLPGPPDAGADDGGEPEEPPSILTRERLGELEIGLAADEVTRLLGAPVRRGRAEMSEATGSYVQQWSWPDRGLELTLDAADKRGPYALAAIRAVAPCALRTARGIGIGDLYKTVEAAYLADRDPEEEQDALSFVAGSVYSGVIFTFDAQREKVTEIFFGAAAE
ncbi:hypothetical protein [Nannocystis punicea]|uniref:Lipoprotein n=1 Tax=Nannocystis punicea TaxID=2995304 RepID=A0ABY7H526_9BACT|nr:hypothetical protein [Nannocystis poenicansa]WAS94129.1 hypothetical protein O0S08_49030 [Nannocystis poenicansa]